MFSAQADGPDSWPDFGRWQRDPDGVLRDIDREVEVWSRKLVTFVPFTVPHIRRLHGVQLADDQAADLSGA